MCFQWDGDGGPAVIRTRDLRFRKPLLYPSELQGHEQESLAFHQFTPANLATFARAGACWVHITFSKLFIAAAASAEIDLTYLFIVVDRSAWRRMAWMVLSGIPRTYRFVAKPRRNECQPCHFKPISSMAGLITRVARLSRFNGCPFRAAGMYRSLGYRTPADENQAEQPAAVRLCEAQWQGVIRQRTQRNVLNHHQLGVRRPGLQHGHQFTSIRLPICRQTPRRGAVWCSRRPRGSLAAEKYSLTCDSC